MTSSTATEEAALAVVGRRVTVSFDEQQNEDGGGFCASRSKNDEQQCPLVYDDEILGDDEDVDDKNDEGATATLTDNDTQIMKRPIQDDLYKDDSDISRIEANTTSAVAVPSTSKAALLKNSDITISYAIQSSLRFIHPELTRLELTCTRSAASSSSWGLAISLMCSSSILLIASVNHNIVQHHKINHLHLSHVVTKGHQQKQQQLQLYPGDAILSINNIPISHMKSLSKIISYLSQQTSVSLVVVRLPIVFKKVSKLLQVQKLQLCNSNRNRNGNESNVQWEKEATIYNNNNYFKQIAHTAWCTGREIYQRVLHFPSIFIKQSTGMPFQFQGKKNSNNANGSSPTSVCCDVDNGKTVCLGQRWTNDLSLSSSSVILTPPSSSSPCRKQRRKNHYNYVIKEKSLSFSSARNGITTVLKNTTKKRKRLQQEKHDLSFSSSSHYGGVKSSAIATSIAASYINECNRVFEILIGITDPEKDGMRSVMFLNPLVAQDPHGWLEARQRQWRREWKIRPIDIEEKDFSQAEEEMDLDCIVQTESLWKSAGFTSFYHWLDARQSVWKRSYTWNVRKRRRLEKDYQQIVRLPSIDLEDEQARGDFNLWLHVRRNQWKISRRRRQRLLYDNEAMTESKVIIDDEHNSAPALALKCTKQSGNLTNQKDSQRFGKTKYILASLSLKAGRPSTSDADSIDALLEEQDLRKQKNLVVKHPMDISFIFDANLGVPDDVICYCMRYLHHTEHGKFLSINRATKSTIQKRSDMWRDLCPSRWRLPKRPRQPWHVIYMSKLRAEADEAVKRSDDTLVRACNIIERGDHVSKLERLVVQATKKFHFNINYSSGFVQERNSLLNIAVLHGRNKIVKWLVESKGADIESSDRGQFTPLMNAAWAGNKLLVRFLLARGADRTKIGTAHYSQCLALPDFKGLPAEGWARKKGHEELAELIRLGLA